MKVVSTQNLTIINHNGNYYRFIFAFISKKDAYNLIKNAAKDTEKKIKICRRNILDFFNFFKC